jgi:Protein of unknown function (DUF3088)
MSRDRLLLLPQGFEDAQRPGVRWVCPHSLPIEGLLAAEPALATRLDIEHIPFARPRAQVIAALDEDHQALPVLILGDEQPPPADAQRLGETYFVSDSRRILELLNERHGFPRVR